jgi:hypothetical protein
MRRDQNFESRAPRNRENSGHSETKERCKLSQDTKTPKSGAARMRAYRRRRRRGFRCVVVQIGPAEVNGLIANGYLPPDKQRDIHAIQLAVNDLLFDWLQQT